MKIDNIGCVILGAGEGKRMKSKLPKVLHKLCGKPLIEYVLENVLPLKLKKYIVVINEKIFNEYFNDNNKFRGIEIAYQDKARGTADAVCCAQQLLTDDNISVLLVLCADMPFISTKTLRALINQHIKDKEDLTLLAAITDDPTGYGRIIQKNGKIIKIVEEKDATLAEKKINLINTGVYCFNKNKLFDIIKEIKKDNKQKEFYLTDAVELFANMEAKINYKVLKDKYEIMGINDRYDLSIAEQALRGKILENLMKEGVTIVSPVTTFIDAEVIIKEDTTIYPFSFILGKTKIGRNCIIGPYSYIKDSQIGNNVIILSSFVFNSRIEDDVKVGPFSHLRGEVNLSKGVKIGNFVELKKSTINESSKIQHMSYIGDTTVGKSVNIGAGSITCNYDGERKYKTYIEDEAFIGSNSNLIAPVKIGKGAVIGAGSTINKDVPAYALGIARVRQKNIENWRKEKIKNKNKNE